MLKKAIAGAVLMLILIEGAAFAAEQEGDVVFRDALYGAAIGAVLGGAIYLVDDEDFAAKMGVGVAVGTIGGLFFGVTETRSAVHIKKGEAKFGPPVIVVEKRNGATMFRTSLLRVDF